MDFLPHITEFQNGNKVEKNNWAERRKEIIEILSKEEYGFLPDKPKSVSGTIINRNEKCCSGHAVAETVEIKFDTPRGIFSFPIKIFNPVKREKSPLIFLINFSRNEYDEYCPTEEIIDNGFALATLYYEDVTKDNDDFSDGIAKMYDRNGESSWGKISMWAFACSRAIDYLVTREEFDCENLALVGHSRLGKTALWCGAQDERIKFICSNGSGCCGAAYDRTKKEGAETINAIIERFPYWFCDRFKRYYNNNQNMPFDQHFLLAAIAPRYICIGDAFDDDWADQYSCQLSCVGASEVWKLLGKKGFSGDETPAKIGDVFSDGDISYHLRDGIHYLGRYDWLKYMDFIKKHI